MARKRCAIRYLEMGADRNLTTSFCALGTTIHGWTAMVLTAAGLLISATSGCAGVCRTWAIQCAWHLCPLISQWSLLGTLQPVRTPRPFLAGNQLNQFGRRVRF